MDSAVPSAFIATLPPFQFHSGSTENFDVKGPDVGELIQLIIQVKINNHEEAGKSLLQLECVCV